MSISWYFHYFYKLVLDGTWGNSVGLIFFTCIFSISISPLLYQSWLIFNFPKTHFHFVKLLSHLYQHEVIKYTCIKIFLNVFHNVTYSKTIHHWYMYMYIHMHVPVSQIWLKLLYLPLINIYQYWVDLHHVELPLVKMKTGIISYNYVNW